MSRTWSKDCRLYITGATKIASHGSDARLPLFTLKQNKEPSLEDSKSNYKFLCGQIFASRTTRSVGRYNSPRWLEPHFLPHTPYPIYFHLIILILLRPAILRFIISVYLIFAKRRVPIRIHLATIVALYSFAPRSLSYCVCSCVRKTKATVRALEIP